MQSPLVLGALAIVALQVLGLAYLGSAPTGFVFSHTVLAFSSFLSGMACLQAGSRSTYFVRTYWRLCAAAFFFWSVSQAVRTYEIYATGHLQYTPLSVILYFFAFTPMFAALILPRGVRDKGLGWEWYLDCLQILIIIGAIYLLFLYGPSWQLTDEEWISRRAIAGNLRNLLLCAGFALRILTVHARHQRELYLRVGVPVALYSLGYWFGRPVNSQWLIRHGSWVDLGWTLPFLLLVVLAVGWHEEPSDKESGKSKGFAPIVLAYILCMALPVVVFWLLRSREKVSDFEAFLICGASALVITFFFIRLGFTQYSQHLTFERLRTSEERYRSLFENNLAGVFRAATDGSYLDCNEAYARIYGYASREEVLSDNTLARYAKPSDRAERIALLRQKKSFTNMEVPQRRKDGTFIWVLQNLALLEDEQGNEFIEGTIVDVTERRLAEAKILDWKNRYEAAVRASGQIIYDWDLSTKEVTFGGNFERLTGISAEEIASVSSRWRELIHPDDLKRYTKEADRLIALGGESMRLEYRVRRKNGSYATVKDEGQFLLDESGKVMHMIGFLTDITEQRTLEEQLRQSQKMEAVGRLAGGLAHDFNNLLTVIKGYSRMVLDAPGLEEKIRVDVAHIDSAAERAASLTSHLLAFSRKQVLQPKVINLNSLMVSLHDMLRRLIGEDIEIVTLPAKDLGAVKADPGQIEQVIMNLVVNARDAMPGGGKITLETANADLDADYGRDHDEVLPGRYVMLAVSDTGVGMDAKTQSRIFEPFFTTKEMGRGTGLGLSIVYGIVKQSSGHIWVYSEPGHGTTFKLYFARVDDPEEIISKVSKPPASVRGQETILLVEDDQHVRQLTHAVLTASGYSVLAAGDGRTVANICSEYLNDIHLLLTDVVMPGTSGREAASQVSTRWPKVKVLFMSGYTENAIVHRGVLDTGAFFLPKPFTPSELTRKVRQVLDGDA